MIRLISSIEVHEVHESDRYICIHRSNNRITGLNYAQGIGCYDDLYNKDGWLYRPDSDLTVFVSAVIPRLLGGKPVTVEIIDDAIWAYVQYKNNDVEFIKY
jgi:hypothetical protein